MIRTSKLLRRGHKTFKHENLSIVKTEAPKAMPPKEDLIFGKHLSDHMFEVEWTKEEGWGNPKIVPLHNLDLAPSVSSLHYAIQCFEGLKAYKNNDGEVRLFRPDRNAARMNISCQRLGLPAFEEKEFVKCLADLVDIERNWIPTDKGYSLYIRPTAISTDSTLGVLPPKKAMLYIIASPVGPYFQTGFEPVQLFATRKYVRAWKGGAGNSKIGSNYAPTIKPHMEALAKGSNQVLWLGEGDRFEEVGTMNVFVYWENEKGEKELVTPPLSNATILPGITRDSIINIAREKFGITVNERNFTIHEVAKAIEEGRMIESFGAGTACIVCPVKAIDFEGKILKIPTPEDGLTTTFFDHILDIQTGQIPSPYSLTLEDVREEKL